MNSEYAFILDLSYRRLAHLPDFYTIDGIKCDGYSYIYYINGNNDSTILKQSITGNSIVSFTPLTRPLKFLSSITQPFVSKASSWFFNKGNSNNLISLMFGSMASAMDNLIQNIVDRSK